MVQTSSKEQENREGENNIKIKQEDDNDLSEVAYSTKSAQDISKASDTLRQYI